MSKKKKFFYGFFTDIGISGVKIAKMLLLIPLVINYTSSELYGIYLSMLSVVGLLGLIDLGSGIFIIKELAKDNSEKIKIKTFASVSNLIILNTLLILIVGVIIYPLVLNLSPNSFAFLLTVDGWHPKVIATSCEDLPCLIFSFNLSLSIFICSPSSDMLLIK